MKSWQAALATPLKQVVTVTLPTEYIINLQVYNYYILYDCINGITSYPFTTTGRFKFIVTKLHILV